MKNLELQNRNYISWSQYSLYKKSPEEYKRRYIDGEEMYISKEMDFGKNFAIGLDKGSNDIEIESARICLPNYPKSEFEITETYKGVIMKGVLDLFNPRKKIIGEVKTGKKWTQKRADNHGQLKFYNILHLAKYGVMAKEIILYWFETDNSGEMRLTGNFKVFKVEHRLSDLLLFFNDVKKINKEIIKLRKYGK